jgi:site-specific DNA-methyltransferase (cytosine-N4-specific)
MKLVSKQMTLFDTESALLSSIRNNDNWRVEQFSAGGLFCEAARQALEEKYLPITEVTTDFNRQSVSYQLNKKDCLHRWLKYKEGFSADLVEKLLYEMDIKLGEIVLDPFLGSGTTCLVAQMQGINSIGFDIMPMSKLAMYAKGNISSYNIDELRKLVNFLLSLQRPSEYNIRTKSVPITDFAYPEETKLDIQFYTEAIEDSSFSVEAKGLATLCLVNCLERLSYTAKDGQYLRWDERSRKVIEANKARVEAGRPPFKVILNKGKLPTVKGTICTELKNAIDDIIYLKNISPFFSREAFVKFKQSSSLIELPLLENEFVNGVITSPPYCNRYDYTRIYALELVYLGMGEKEIRQMRQDLISCTVESKTKIEFLHEYYISINREESYNNIISIIQNTAALSEVLQALSFRNERGDINNKGVLSMVKSYFEELAFIYYELFRICKNGAKVAFVNDNVRYAGEVIPVDFISTEIAERIGFTPSKIYTLKQQKGNSSQQMKKFGRVPLRKSITLWEK